MEISDSNHHHHPYGHWHKHWGDELHVIASDKLRVSGVTPKNNKGQT